MKRSLTILLSIFVLFLSHLSHAFESTCSNFQHVVVKSRSTTDIPFICNAAERAAIYLFHLDLLPKRNIQIDVTDEPIIIHGNKAYGAYNAATDRISIMSYPSIFDHSKKPMMLGEPFDRVHYMGAIAHEVAHAIVQQNATNRVTVSSHEYLAYATQLRVLPAERRDDILDTMNVLGWSVGDSISEVYLAMQPGKFAAKSYLHISSLPDPVIFMKILLQTTRYYVNVPDLRNIPQ